MTVGVQYFVDCPMCDGNGDEVRGSDDECIHCDGTGEVCAHCGDAPSACICFTEDECSATTN